MTLTPGMKVHRMDMTLACMQEWSRNHNHYLEFSIRLKTIIILKKKHLASESQNKKFNIGAP